MKRLESLGSSILQYFEKEKPSFTSLAGKEKKTPQ